jgi:hypothetical protein
MRRDGDYWYGQAIRWSTAATVIGATVVAAVVSYERAYALVRAHGEADWTGRPILSVVTRFPRSTTPD